MRALIANVDYVNMHKVISLFYSKLSIDLRNINAYFTLIHFTFSFYISLHIYAYTVSH